MSQRTGHRSLAGYIDDIFFYIRVTRKGHMQMLKESIMPESK